MGFARKVWIPAFAGMTGWEMSQPTQISEAPGILSPVVLGEAKSKEDERLEAKRR